MTRGEFDHLVRQMSRKLYGFAFRILRDQQEAEDVVQEIFLRLWKMGDKLDSYKSVEALSVTMIRNYCIDITRRQKHLPEVEISSAVHEDILYPSPYDQMVRRESGEILDAIISGLPEPYRVAVRSRDIDGESYEEIALKTGQNINTLRVTLSRARKIIRDKYNQYQYERRGIEKADRKVL